MKLREFRTKQSVYQTLPFNCLSGRQNLNSTVELGNENAGYMVHDERWSVAATRQSAVFHAESRVSAARVLANAATTRKFHRLPRAVYVVATYAGAVVKYQIQMIETPRKCTDYQWLTSGQAKPYLEVASRHLSQSTDLIELIRSLRAELTVEQSQLVIKQSQLRKRAEKKFSRAATMFFTEKGLEQSSGELLADYKSLRFRESDRLADLCCGIGGDAMSLARQASVAAVDQDPCTAWFAQANLDLLDNANANVLSNSVDSIQLNRFDAWHIDPDQRDSGKRSKRPESLSPSLGEIENFVQQNGNACIKLSPLTRDLPAWTSAAETEFIGDRRECKQQLLWFGALKSETPNRATIVAKDGTAIHICGDAPRGQESFRAKTATEISGILYEPHAAVIAAGLVDVLAVQLNLRRLGETIAYLIGDSATVHPALAAFEIVDATTIDRRQVMQMLRRHNASVADIKKRGVDHRILERFKTLKKVGELPHTLILANTISGNRAILARRIDTAEAELT